MGEPPLIEARALSTTAAGVGVGVLRGVDFRVEAGERVILTGASGSGKSTLLRGLVLLEPVAVRLLLDGEPVGPDRVRELRRRVGYVPQRPVAIATTVGEDLAFARASGPGLTAGEQWTLLARLGLAGLEGTRRFDALSGGEQQRVALVRSLTASPDVLLLDEPTASLDPEKVGGVLDLVREWSVAEPRRALVWVSHQAHEVADLATRRVTMAELTS